LADANDAKVHWRDVTAAATAPAEVAARKIRRVSDYRELFGVYSCGRLRQRREPSQTSGII